MWQPKRKRSIGNVRDMYVPSVQIILSHNLWTFIPPFMNIHTHSFGPTGLGSIFCECYSSIWPSPAAFSLYISTVQSVQHLHVLQCSIATFCNHKHIWNNAGHALAYKSWLVESCCKQCQPRSISWLPADFDIFVLCLIRLSRLMRADPSSSCRFSKNWHRWMRPWKWYEQ